MSIDFSITLKNGGFILDANCKLPENATIALIGKSGSGKTTLLRCLAGLEKTAEGHIEFQDETWQNSSSKVFLPSEYRRVGYVFQQGALFPNLTVSQNIEYARKRAKGTLSHSLQEAIVATRVDRLANRKADTLSGGETQRVALARALSSNPKLLIMDEPLSALDWEGRAALVECLEKTLKAIDIPTIFVTHTLADAAKLANYAIRMDGGKIVAHGLSSEILPDNYELSDDRREPFVTFEATITSHDDQYALTQLDSQIGPLQIPQCPQPIGGNVQVTIWSRDVSLSLHPPEQTSLLNALPGKIARIEEFDKSRTLVTLESPTGTLKSMITHKSAAQLNLAPGDSAFGLIKSVSFTS